jgi:hypothetical protein
MDCVANASLGPNQQSGCTVNVPTGNIALNRYDPFQDVTRSGVLWGGLRGEDGLYSAKFQRVKSNAQANRIAREFGYDNAEELKLDLTGSRTTSKFDVYRDTATGRYFVSARNGERVERVYLPDRVQAPDDAEFEDDPPPSGGGGCGGEMAAGAGGCGGIFPIVPIPAPGTPVPVMPGNPFPVPAPVPAVL